MTCGTACSTCRATVLPLTPTVLLPCPVNSRRPASVLQPSRGVLGLGEEWVAGDAIDAGLAKHRGERDFLYST